MARDLEKRFIVITGANTGIGQATAEILAARGASVLLACRSEEKTRPVIDGIRAAGGDADFLSLDLGSLASAREAGEKLAAAGRPIDVLINNAGVAGQQGLTKDGFELHFGTNHLGHFLFTMKLAPVLKAGKARVVNVSSNSHYQAKGIDYAVIREKTRSITGMAEYEVSKLANVLFTRESSKHLGKDGVHSYALHPGVVASDAWRRIPWPIRPLIKVFMITNEQGAATSVMCAVSPDVASHDGRFYDHQKEREPSKPAQDDEAARVLWEKSVEITGADWA